MVRKIISIVFIMLLTAGAMCAAVSAETFNTYEGNLSSTQITYFRDILAGESLLDNYVCFRAEQNTYYMVVGDLEYSSGVFTLNDSGRVYKLDTSGSNYNNYYTYSFSTISDFTLNTQSRIVYSDIGFFPQLEERGQKYEIITTILCGVVMLSIVINRIFFHRSR